MIAMVGLPIAFLVCVLLLPKLIRFMRLHRLGQTVNDLGPKAHLDRQGTPTMGGLVIVLATVLGALIAAPLFGAPWQVLPMLLAALGAMAVGLVDDAIKLKNRRNLGLTAKQKILGQVAVGFFWAMYCYLHAGNGLLVPFTQSVWYFGMFYVPLMMLLFVFFTNSANLQDGLDGLLSTVTVAGAAALGLIALLLNNRFGSGDAAAVSALCFALTGACLGFFIFNRHPAKVMMGDTGSMFIGGVFVATSMILGLQIWLLFVCFTMMLSSLSVIVQRLYFKYSHGKRIFHMTPIHHHFEALGMKEKRIVLMYGVAALLASALGVLAILPVLR